MQYRLTSLMIAIAFAATASSPAFAGGGTTSKPKAALPGVTSDYRIAKPAPQPEPDDAWPAGENGTFKIGNTDVRVSGSITIDMGTGGIRPSNH
jgi:FlaG/FlaF family flagellin (archaellin)